MKKIKITVLILLLGIMIFFTVQSSLAQNLFTEWDEIHSGPWFTTTLIDFYINQFYLWILPAILEKKIYLKIFWLILMICFGSMATSLYFLIKILKNKNILIREV